MTGGGRKKSSNLPSATPPIDERTFTAIPSRPLKYEIRGDRRGRTAFKSINIQSRVLMATRENLKPC